MLVTPEKVPVAPPLTVSETFFNQRNPDHPKLHSFPTRRSSDLSTVGADKSTSPPAVAKMKTVAPGMPPVKVGKSTRLNSIHLRTSYTSLFKKIELLA